MKGLRFHPLDFAASAAFLAYAASATVTPIVLVTLSRELEFTLIGGGGLEVVRSGFIFSTLLCSGFVAAHFGKARALGGSLLPGRREAPLDCGSKLRAATAFHGMGKGSGKAEARFRTPKTLRAMSPKKGGMSSCSHLLEPFPKDLLYEEKNTFAGL